MPLITFQCADNVLQHTGMSLPACNPRLGYGVTSALATYYPERLGLVVCINHNPVFQGVWNAFKVFLHPNTVAKMQLLRKKTKYQEAFRRLFDDELASWLLDEIKLNKQRPMPVSQREFWKAPESASGSAHDPRGCASYVRQYIDPFLAEIRLETLR
jgi:CRAL/TRIO domain